MTYFTYRHSSDLIDLVEQSVDHTTLCLSIFWGFLSAIKRAVLFLTYQLNLGAERKAAIFLNKKYIN
ncbi:hypothetical protein CKY02_12530 [Photorhabdus bodei]|uniref:Uncharacterized protein n=1 Tax=Photorhabdus bodei TaxID=2029681 RepID=A0A329X7J6_9GAMM|nr:hypothetical protein CKY02_12530 [Photorhabdus bodei]